MQAQIDGGMGALQAMLDRELAARANGWLPLDSCPEDEVVLLSVTGGWVGTGFWLHNEIADRIEWYWQDAAPLHQNHKPLGWQPLPEPLPDPES